jgi:histidine phosphotransferase ChpT
MQPTELAGILCARICHDLGSPVGAVVNGIDLVRDLAAGEAGAELDMVERSAQRAAALLRFHRLAFGILRDPGQRLSRAELARTAGEVLAGPRVEIAWSALDGPALGAPAARLTALMLLAGRAMLGIGGTLRVVLPADGDLPVAVLAEGGRVAVSEAQRRWLTLVPGPGPDAPQIEFALLPDAAAAAGARVELIEGAGQVALRAIAH